MGDLYLLSSIVDGTEVFYTSNDGSITDIGKKLDWSKGFDKDTLSLINNSVYSALVEPKIYCNNTNKVSASEITSGDGIVWTTDATAINTTGYSGVTKITPTCTNDVKFAISFDKRKTYYTRGQGIIPSNSVVIPSTADARKRAGITIPSGTEALFDSNASTQYVVSPSKNVTVEVNTNSSLIVRRYILSLNKDCRLPLIATFYAYDQDSEQWVELDKVTINVTKDIVRTFTNSISSNSYKWELTFNTNLFGDDPSKDLVLNGANLYGQSTGSTWLPCKLSEIKDKGMTVSTLTALAASDYSDIFAQGQLDYAAYIPKGGSLTKVLVSLPVNSAPNVTDILADRTSTHGANVALMFTITDPEGSICEYDIAVNGTVVDGARNIASGTRCKTDLKNEWFTIIDDKATVPIEQNVVTIIARDEYGAESKVTYNITKIDNLPSFTGVMVDNEYIFSIDDIDHDRVKYTAFINDKQFASSDFMDVPSVNNRITISSDDIIIGKKNVLTVLLTDAVGGTTPIKIEFIGEYYGLLFLDEDGNILSSDIGRVINKLKLNSIICGQTSLASEITIWNKSSHSINSISIKSPKDINGIDKPQYNNGVFNGVTHIDGDIVAQISNNDSFNDPNSFYAINLKNLAPNEKTKFYMRVVSDNPGSKGGTFDFDITAYGNK